MKINLPELGKERVVIIGAGFGGLNLAKRLVKQDYQVVLIDKYNFHQFQPLFYQVAMAGLEPSSIVFPVRKYFQKKKNFFFRVTEVQKIDTEKQQLQTTFGPVNYDHLVLATGADTNFFGNEKIANMALPMKSVSEALHMRNRILGDFERALTETDIDQRQEFLDIVVVGGGPTGVEVAGSLAEMKKYILPKDYPELNYEEVDIYLVEGNKKLLKAMSEKASEKSLQFLEELGVKVILGTIVKDFDGQTVYLSDDRTIPCRKLIWAAGIKGNVIEGLDHDLIVRGNRIKVDGQCKVPGFDNIYAIGDIAYMETEDYPYGHAQVAQTAIQQAKYLAKYFKNRQKGKSSEPFEYKDLGSMATVGRNRAVVDLPKGSFSGFFAWFTWLAVHLFQLLGVRNKVLVFLNWIWSYLTYDQSLRLIIRPYHRTEMQTNSSKIEPVEK